MRAFEKLNKVLFINTFDPIESIIFTVSTMPLGNGIFGCIRENDISNCKTRIRDILYGIKNNTMTNDYSTCTLSVILCMNSIRVLVTKYGIKVAYDAAIKCIVEIATTVTINETIWKDHQSVTRVHLTSSMVLEKLIAGVRQSLALLPSPIFDKITENAFKGIVLIMYVSKEQFRESKYAQNSTAIAMDLVLDAYSNKINSLTGQNCTLSSILNIMHTMYDILFICDGVEADFQKCSTLDSIIMVVKSFKSSNSTVTGDFVISYLQRIAQSDCISNAEYECYAGQVLSILSKIVNYAVKCDKQGSIAKYIYTAAITFSNHAPFYSRLSDKIMDVISRTYSLISCYITGGTSIYSNVSHERFYEICLYLSDIVKLVGLVFPYVAPDEEKLAQAIVSGTTSLGEIICFPSSTCKVGILLEKVTEEILAVMEFLVSNYASESIMSF